MVKKQQSIQQALSLTFTFVIFQPFFQGKWPKIVSVQDSPELPVCDLQLVIPQFWKISLLVNLTGRKKAEPTIEPHAVQFHLVP